MARFRVCSSASTFRSPEIEVTPDQPNVLQFSMLIIIIKVTMSARIQVYASIGEAVESLLRLSAQAHICFLNSLLVYTPTKLGKPYLKFLGYSA